MEETTTTQLEAGQATEEPEAMIDLIQFGSEGDKKKSMRLTEALRVVRAALKSGKVVFKKTKDGRGEVVRSEKEIDGKTKEVTVAPPVGAG